MSKLTAVDLLIQQLVLLQEKYEALLKEFEQYKRESIKWSVEDFIEFESYRYTITKDQAQDALERMIQKHDACDGITWDTVEYYLSQYGTLKEVTMSKLYTKEMFLIAAEKCEVSMIDAKHIMQYIDEYVTPIELPTDDKPMRYHCVPKEISDEEIKKAAIEYADKVYDKSDFKDEWRDVFNDFISAAKWYREQLKGGNNE